MRFFAPVLAVLAATASVTAVGNDNVHQLGKRDFAAIAQAGLKIFGDLDDLQSRLQRFQGSIPDALAILNSTDTLNNDIKATSDAVVQTPSLTDDQASLLAAQIATLSTPIFNVLDLLQTKRPKFQTVGGGIPTGFVVLQRLQTLKNTTDIFGNNLIPKLSLELRKVAPLITSNYDYHFIRAIQLYQRFF